MLPASADLLGSRVRSLDGAATADQLLLNPLRSEGEAFRFLLYVAGAVVAVVLVVLFVRALA